MLSCSGIGFIGEIKGSIAPEVGNGFLEFTGAPSSLKYGAEAVTVIKRDRLNGIGAAKITAKYS